MKKYFVAVTIALGLLCSAFVGPFARAFDVSLPPTPVIPPLDVNVFTDVNVSSPYYNALVYLKSAGIVSGYGDGSFKPDAKINRAEFTKIVVGAVRPTPDDYLCLSINFQPSPGIYVDMFTDVISTTDAWYLSPICYAKKQNLVNGYPDGSFRPAQNINFAEAAKIMFNGFQGSDAFVPPLDPKAPWYFTYANDLAFRNAIPMTITRFDQQITRGEMAEIAFRLRTKNTSLSSRTYAELR